MLGGSLYFIRTLLLSAVDLYVFVIFIYILMSWIPNNAYGRVGDVYRALGKLCEPFLSPFRRIIPPIGGMLDISPIVAIFVLQFAARIIAVLL